MTPHGEAWARAGSGAAPAAGPAEPTVERWTPRGRANWSSSPARALEFGAYMARPEGTGPRPDRTAGSSLDAG